MEINTGIVAEHMGMSVGWTPDLFHVHQLKAEPMRVMMRFSPGSRTAGLHNLDLLRSQLVANGNAAKLTAALAQSGIRAPKPVSSRTSSYDLMTSR